jgi:hypothetical protein
MRNGNMENWRHGDMETWRYEDMVKWTPETWTWRHGQGDMELKHWRSLMLYKKNKMENESPGNFL